LLIVSRAALTNSDNMAEVMRQRLEYAAVKVQRVYRGFVGRRLALVARDVRL
jgi:hypothetical protein